MGIYKRKGTKVWTMDFMFNGQRIFESTGMTSKVKAQDVFDRRKRELKDSAAGIVKKQQPLLLSVAAAKWQEAKSPKWSKKMRQIAEYAVGHLSPELGKQLLMDIDASDIRRYQTTRTEEGASPRTINIEVGALRQIMKKFGSWERVKESEEWQDVGMLEERTDAGHALTTHEQLILLTACRRSVSRALRPFVVLLLETGARYNTIRTLKWGQIDFDHGRLKIGKDKTKSGTGRLVPLSARADKALRRWAALFPERRPSHYVFPSESYGLHGTEGQVGKGGEVKVYDYNPEQPVGTIKTAWQTAKKRTAYFCPACIRGTLVKRAEGFACDRCGEMLPSLPAALAKLRLHDLRHTAVSRMVAARVPLPTIAKVVGWSPSTTVAMAARYAHPAEDELREAVEAISGFSKGSRQFPRQSTHRSTRRNTQVADSKWSGRRDSNPRPSAPKADALPDCATPRLDASSVAQRLLPTRRVQTVQQRPAQPQQQQERQHRERHQPQRQHAQEHPVAPRVAPPGHQRVLQQVVIAPVRPPADIEQVPQHRHQPHSDLDHQVHHHARDRHQRHAAHIRRQHDDAARRAAEKIPDPRDEPDNAIQPEADIRPRHAKPRIQHARQQVEVLIAKHAARSTQPLPRGRRRKGAGRENLGIQRLGLHSRASSGGVHKPVRLGLHLHAMRCYN